MALHKRQAADALAEPETHAGAVLMLLLLLRLLVLMLALTLMLQLLLMQTTACWQVTQHTPALANP